MVRIESFLYGIAVDNNKKPAPGEGLVVLFFVRFDLTFSRTAKRVKRNRKENIYETPVVADWVSLHGRMWGKGV